MGNRVLVATDGSELSRKTAEFVVRMKQVLPLEVDLGMVVDMHPLDYRAISPMYMDMIREGAKATVENLLKKEEAFYESQGVKVNPRILYGAPAQAICSTAADEGFPFLVMGRKGKGGDIQDVLFGSVSRQVVHGCKRPVLVVKGRGPIRKGEEAKKPLRVLVPLDDTPGALRCLEFLRASRWAQGTEVSLLHVVNANGPELEHLPDEFRSKALQGLHEAASALLERSAAALREAGFSVSTRVEEGNPAKVVCGVYAEEGFEVTVLGRHGPGSVEDTLLSPVTNYILHHCPGHILLVP
ncbi:MAG: universal stress protein [Deltaproteobacteria bacterium]|nr:universal stress protein [Deltaproteobacteria bacterium]